MIFKPISFMFAVVSASMAFVPAHALVPGSDTYERVRDAAALQSVVRGPTGAVRGTVLESRSYGYRHEGTRIFKIPGSERANDAADAAALHSVVKGVGRNAFEIGRAEVDRSGVLVPGSDSY